MALTVALAFNARVHVLLVLPAHAPPQLEKTLPAVGIAKNLNDALSAAVTVPLVHAVPHDKFKAGANNEPKVLPDLL